MKVRIENVRCIENCDLFLSPGSRTVLIGTNNSGKSSLLDVLAKSIWSIPGHGNYSGDHMTRLGLSTSYYRRQGATIFRPQVSIEASIQSVFPNEPAFSRQHNKIRFSLSGAVSEKRVEQNNPSTTLLVPYSISILLEGGQERFLVRPNRSIAEIMDLFNETQLALDVSLANEPEWERRREMSDFQNWTVQGAGHLSSQNSPFTRALKGLIGRTFYISAGRNPLFAAHESDLDLRQDRINDITPLLKRLAYDPIKWNVLQSAITLLFEEISELKLLPVGQNVAPHVLSNSGDVVPVSDMGFGLRNALQILTVMSVAPKGAILVVDEPEQGLNQARQRDLAKLIEMLRPDLTLLLATQAEAFCKGLESSSLYLVENRDGRALVEQIDLRGIPAHRKRMAKAMGINPLYLVEGGKIIFVEGSSDQKIVSDWLALNFSDTEIQNVQIQDLGGVGKVEEEFAKPMFLNFKDNIFFLLDSDRTTEESIMGQNIERLVSWFNEKHISNYYVLRKREIENYLGAHQLAKAAGINVGSIQPVAGSESWFDYKKAVENEKGFYDENKITVKAYRELAVTVRKTIFADENQTIIDLVKGFLRD